MRSTPSSASSLRATRSTASVRRSRRSRIASSSRSSSGRRGAFAARPPAHGSGRGGPPPGLRRCRAGRGERVAVRLEHDSVEPPIEPEVREHRRRGLARPHPVGGDRRPGTSQLAEQLADRRIAAELHAGVVAVEARELEAQVRELLARPLVELAPGRGAVARELVGGQRSDRAEAAREMLDGGERDPRCRARGRPRRRPQARRMSHREATLSDPCPRHPAAP